VTSAGILHLVPGGVRGRGLDSALAQCSISFNTRIQHSKGHVAGGMHYQAEPYAETKLVRSTRGATVDAVVDLRSESPTFKRWASVVLTAEDRNRLYIPKSWCAASYA
jgi:dTDP-4-dehydrorhamnose 3,5-epimerase